MNNAEWGTDYLNRTGTAKSNMYDNRPEETKYIYTDDDSQGKQLNGQNTYAIAFAKGQVPPVKGFWSVTLYNGSIFLIRTRWGAIRWAPRRRPSSTRRMAP